MHSEWRPRLVCGQLGFHHQMDQGCWRQRRPGTGPGWRQAGTNHDWKLGLSKDFGVVTGALAVIGTNANTTAYASPANGKFLGKTALQLTVSKTF